ncbi:hypothetical protein KP509_02G092700 [Ceratopteris richardii]|nr:hypothetical protein KP509_02G092700 [Ceratopteris richardii]
MDGGSLADHLRRSGGRLHEEAEAAYFTRAVLQGLDYLHSAGIVHCDIKPQNILLGSSGIKIADFGCARRMGYPSAIDGVLRGTPLYMAPEVVQGLEQGPASDIWSLGCTLIHMLQGCPPWAHVRCLPALFLKIGSSDEEPPLPHLISPQARDFLLRCLQRDPKSRSTATELLKHPFLNDLLQRGDALQLSDYMTDEESRSSTLKRSIRVIKDVVSHCAEEPACRCCRSSLPFRGLLDYTMSQ